MLVVAGNRGVDRRGFGGDRLPDIRQPVLRHGERHVDWRDLVDGGERGDIGGTHEIADLDRRGAHAAVDRRADGAEAKLDLEIIQRGAVGLDRGAENIGLRLGVIEIDDRRRTFGDEIGKARDVAFGAFELRLVARNDAFGLRDLRPELAVIEGEQQVALFHAGAVGEVHADDFGFQPRLDGDAGDRRHGAQRVDGQRDHLLFGFGDVDGDDTFARRLRDGSAAAPDAASKHNNADKGDRCHPEEPLPLHHHRLHYIRPVRPEGPIRTLPFAAVLSFPHPLWRELLAYKRNKVHIPAPAYDLPITGGKF